MKVAIYIRVSTPGQAVDGFSLDGQQGVLTRYAEAMGYTVHKVYVDAGISAKDMASRPALNEMLEAAYKGKIDAILIWKLSRFTRNLSDLCAVCDKLDKKGVKLLSYSESFDASGSMGRMIRNLLGVIAQWEREVIAENVKMAMAERAQQGKATCGVVLGYRLDKATGILEPVPEEAQQVRLIYRLYAQHRSLTRVATLCSAKGMKGARGGKLLPESIRKILSCPIYCGYGSFQGQRFYGGFPAILHVSMFNAIQHELNRNAASYGRIGAYETLPGLFG